MFTYWTVLGHLPRPLVRSALAKADTEPVDADLRLADDVIDRRYQDIETSIFALTATRQPVAVGLRLIVTALRRAADLERMGDLAEPAAKIARMRRPESPISPEPRDHIVEMDRVAERMITETGARASRRATPRRAAELDADDDAMDRLHRRPLRALLTTDRPHGIEPAIGITLIGRCYERYADHVVRLAHDVVYPVAGDRPGTSA